MRLCPEDRQSVRLRAGAVEARHLLPVEPFACILVAYVLSSCANPFPERVRTSIAAARKHVRSVPAMVSSFREKTSLRSTGIAAPVQS